ncbi:hypothetical protein [Streptomyces sp. NPDC058228]|uniref:hypothetical protein n=1 Tax=Streptomyces sp. NPDC058228 TaxID=3346390 RepID=UPI0036EF1FAC
MQLDDEARTGGHLLARLKDAPTAVHPPVETSPEVLPLAELTWQDTERLFLRLAERSGTAEYAQQYGTAGQKQAGIDLYVRLAASAADPLGDSRRYLTLQSRRVKELTPRKLRVAVDDFLAGSWAARTTTFIYATTHSLKPTQLAEEVIQQSDRLGEAGITFLAWGLESVSESLRDLPDLVGEFFGPAWTSLFCRHSTPTIALPDTSRTTAEWHAQRLGVHPAAPSPGQQLPAPGFVLPTYVPRPHDTQIQRRLERVAAGRAFELLVVRGSSCTGKTRTAYEAVRAALPHWRLIHPKTAEAVVALVDSQRVSSETVLWLDDAHHLFNEPSGEQAAAALRHLLERPGPGLLVATMWPQHYDELVTPASSGKDRHPQTRELLRAFPVVDIPERFHGRPMRDLKALAQHDSALQAALETVSEPGAIAQTLAAGPDLLDRWEHASCPYGRAVLTAAIDARRLGVRAALPKAFLQAAAPGYLTDYERATAPADWFERATSYCCQRVKGVATALQPVPLPTGMGPRQDVYGLADYLEQHAGEKRANQPIPAPFWEAAEHHVTDGEDLTWLSRHAWGRGARQRAVQTCHKAFTAQAPFAAGWLTNFLGQLGAEPHVFSRIAQKAPLGDPYAISFLLDELRDIDCSNAIDVLLQREPERHVAAENPYYVALLVTSLKALGKHHAIRVLSERAARCTPLEHVADVAYLLEALLEADAQQAVHVLLRRAPATSVRLKERHEIFGSADADDYDAIILLELFGEAGDDASANTLAGRIAQLAPLDNSWEIRRLLTACEQAQAEQHVPVLIERAVKAIPLTDGRKIADFLAAMLSEGTLAGVEAFDALMDRKPQLHVALEGARTTARLINTISAVEWHDAAIDALLTRDPVSRAELGDPLGVAMLLESLQGIGAAASIERLLARSPAVHVELSGANATGVARLLKAFISLDAKSEVETLLARSPADKVSAEGLYRTVERINILDSLGKTEASSTLLRRAGTQIRGWEPVLENSLDRVAREELRVDFLNIFAAHVDLHSAETISRVLRLMHKRAAVDAVELLLARKPCESVSVHDASDAAELIDALTQTGDTTAVARLLAAGLIDDVSIGSGYHVGALSRALRSVGALEANAPLARRVLNAGLFEDYLRCMGWNTSDYHYGIEMDERPSSKWAWNHLGPGEDC